MTHDSEARAARRAYETEELVEQQRESGQAYLEFLRRESLSVGVYALPKGATDPQQPHTEDEVYVVLEGVATLRVEAERHAVEAGSIVFVEAGVEHRFEAIESDLNVLVFFAPAEGSSGADR
jgi:quercetin dioxygenase-like cupin family protein